MRNACHFTSWITDNTLVNASVGCVDVADVQDINAIASRHLELSIRVDWAVIEEPFNSRLDGGVDLATELSQLSVTDMLVSHRFHELRCSDARSSLYCNTYSSLASSNHKYLLLQI